MSKVLETVNDFERARAALLHKEFLALPEALGQFGKETERLSSWLDGYKIEGKELRASVSTLDRLYRQWRTHELYPRQLEALVRNYKPGKPRIPEELVHELHRLATTPGRKALSVAHKLLKTAWFEGREVPGLGCWPDWWRANHPNEPMPSHAPDFPYCKATLYNHQPSKALVALGTKGAKAAREQLPYVEMDYASLRFMELVTLDDVRLDLKGIDPKTGEVIELQAYCMIDAATRMILGFVLRPKGAIRQADVDALVWHVLRTYGIGNGFVTHILFERGSVACSEAKQRVLEGLSNGGIKVHRTGISGGIRWAGQAADKACGNPYGKGIIESFNRTLHLMLNHLPGQRGNCYQNQPQNLDTLSKEAGRLAEIEAKTGVEFENPLFTTFEVATSMYALIDGYNHETGHDFEGHGEIPQQETQPGVWEDCHLVTKEEAQEAFVASRELVHA